MLESYLVKGALVGLVFGVPAGAIGALTIQRCLAYGLIAGLVTGLGSTVADVLYACVGVFGLSMISDFLMTHQTVISVVSGALIAVLGVRIFRKRSTKPITDVERRNRLPVFFSSSFAIAIMNPATILSFIIAFSSFGIAEKPTVSQGGQLIIGILIGTGCWWMLLSGLVCLFRNRVTDAIYQRLNWILGCFMMLFGAFVGIRAFFE